MNLLALYEFCTTVDEQVLANSQRSTALCCGNTLESKVRAAFLLGVYMILRMNTSPDETVQRLSAGVGISRLTETGAGRSDQQGLTVQDCLLALWRSKRLGWVDFEKDGFDPDEFAYFNSGLNADLHEVVPERLIVMRSPRLLDRGEWEDHFEAGRFSHREFSPSYYADILPQFDVTVCVRLGVPRYGRDALAGSGMELEELYCEDSAFPSPDTVARFLEIVDRARGAVALQGDAGLGHAATLAAIYMMQRHGFAAREAVAWLLIICPRW